jgi:hypothetical protein
MQQTLVAHAWPAGERVRVRMGIHCGEAEQTVAGLVGLEVHRAARVAAVGYGGQVLVSKTAAVLVRDWLPTEAALTDLGVHRLKDLGRPERIFELTEAGLQTEFPPLRSLGNQALPNNLPAQLSRFIGRDREVAKARALVESSRLVTLTGARGRGQDPARPAASWMNGLASMRPRFGLSAHLLLRVARRSVPGSRRSSRASPSRRGGWQLCGLLPPGPRWVSLMTWLTS